MVGPLAMLTGNKSRSLSRIIQAVTRGVILFLAELTSNIFDVGWKLNYRNSFPDFNFLIPGVDVFSLDQRTNQVSLVWGFDRLANRIIGSDSPADELGKVVKVGHF